MNYSVRKFTALLLALIMVLSVAPLDAVASVFSTYEANVVVDTSNSAHLTENFFTQSAKTPDGNTAGSVLVGTLREDSLLNGSTVEFSEVAEKPSLRKAVATTSGKRVIAKYNITVKNPDGSVWQPDQKSGETVDVRVTLNNPVQLNPGDRLSLVHESDGQEVPATFYKNANDEMTGFDFEARGFSVYAVVAEGVDARLEVKFNSNGSDIATIWVKKSDLANQTEFEKIVYDPGTGTLPAGVIFLGWTDEPDYELPDEDFTPMTIADIRTAVTEKLNSGVHDIEEATNGDSVTYYAVLAKQYRISYLGDGGVSVGEDVINFRYNAETPNPEVEYTVNMTYTPKDNEHAFMGWLVSEGGNNITGHTEEKVYENETIITISGDVTFAVDAPQGHWLVFDENGKGATYCAPQFVKSGETTHLPRPDAEMVRKGYRFGGWYDTKEHADAHGTDPTITTGQYAFGGELDDGVTIYASWISETTAVYTVIFWTQNQARTGYDVAGSVVVSGTVGANIPYTSVDNIDEDYATGAGFGENGHYTGFCLTEGSKGQTVMIRPENDSVLNLYYDRIHYNFRFYVYRDSRSGQNRYTFADNSGSGRSLDDLVTWNPADRNHPTVNGYTMDSERVGNYDYYFFTLSAYYGEDISSKWPKYDQIQGVGSLQPVSFVMMVGTKLKPNPTNGGSGTVKGIISVLNENILGATNQANGNYVIIRFPAQGYNNWRYHIWFETVEGVDYTGKTTKEYNGRTYYEDNIMEVRSSNLQVNSQNEPKYDGFDFVGKRGQNWTITNINDNSAWTTTENGTTLHHLNYLYNRQVFKISYFDGNYVDGNGNTIQNRATHLLHESRAIGQGADVTADEYAKYIPELPEGELGFIFEGWYTDEGCTSPYTFAKMPIDGIKVYAKWRQIQYRVFLHSMVPASDTTLNWGSANQKMNFRISYGGKISAPYGTRTGYEFSGWYTNPQYNGVFNAENYVLNEQTVSTPYDKSAHLTDPHTIYDGYGTETNEDDDRDWITKEFNLYAKWSKILIGATGIGVKYDEGEGSNPPSDTNLYVDQAKAVAQSASTAPDGKVFAYWVVQKWNGTEYTDTDVHVYPGAQFIVNADDAKVTPHTDDPTKNDYVVQLRAEYVDPIGPPTTHIWWFRNDGTEAFRKDDPIQVNKSVAIEGALTRSGYRFIGWAKVQQNGDTPATTTDAGPYLYYGDDGAFHLGSKTGTKVSKVAADERTPYDNMYAVWIPELKIRITGNTDTKEYNGQEQSVTGYTVEYSVGGGAYSTTAPSGVSVALAEGKTAEAAGTNVNTNPGYLMGLNSESFTISVNAEKYDFNATDDLTITDGWLKITPKKVTITAKDASKEYDGTALTQPEFTVSGLAEGDTHTFTVVMTEDSTITDVGTQPNVIATVDGVAVTTGTETAVGNYLVTTANGTLKITPKKVTITAKDASKEYDGTALTQPEFTVSGLAEGDTHTFTVVMTEDSTITDVGTQPNVIATVDGVAVTTGTETAVGNYLVTTANGTLKITPKKVTITAKDASKEYDGTALTQPEFTVSGLAEGDTHTFTVVMTDDSTITDVGTQPNVIATVDGVAVTTGTETAVGNYLVTTANGTLKITPKKVTITAKDASKEYDGTALTQPEFTVSGLAEGDTHTFTVVMTEDSTITDVGTQPNVIATVDGVAVTTGTETAVGNYLVTTANGTLKITPKKVTITAKDASKEYDGTALTQPEFTVSGLAEGDTHTFTVVMTDDSTITDVGTQPNVIATVDGVAVTTGTETAVGNYLVTTANGTLKITPKKVTITAKDASKEYDGTALTQPEFTVSGLAEGDTHTFTVVMTEDSTITDVGTQPNVIATVDGVAVTTGTETAVGNYLVTTANGTLKITPKKVTITAKDASKEYDGTALTQPEFTVSGLAEGDTHTFTVVMTDDSTITDVGTQPNVIATVDGVAVTTGTETAVGNYLVTTANGTLKITPKKVTITAKDASKEYDGTALTQPEFTVSGLAEGDTHTFTVVMTEDSTITDVGTQPNVIATVDGVAVTTGTETAVGNYLVTTANGTLKITPKKVTITAKDASKEYDGTALTQPEFTVSGLAEGDTHTFTVVMTDDSTITDVGTQPNVIATVDGVAVTTGTETAVGNYLVTTANGTLKITPKKVTITAKDASKEYDGTALTQPEFTVSGLAEGDTHTFTVVMTDDSTITDVGTQPNVIATVDGVAVTTGTETAVGNYLVTTANGTLKITPKKVTITAKDASKEYDGTALTQPEFTVSGLAEGDTHTFTVVMTEDSTITDVGTQPNVIATVDGVAVTTGTETAVGNYLVTTANGTLKITPKKVTITAKDASKEYDGTALTQPEFTVSGLAEGDTHTFTVVMTDDSTITDVGTQPNVIATVDGVAVTTGTETAVGNYLVTTANGTLKITPKKVTITAKDASKEYDGTALTQPEFTVSGLAEGDTHTFTVVMTEDSTITDVGTQPNVIATVDGVAVTTGTETAVGNYLVTTANGTLKITPKKVTITAKDASKEYDGTALTQPEFTVSGLAEGDTHTFTVVMTDDSTITDVGTQPNVIATVDGVAVTTGTETAVGNYLVTTANGTLKITPKKVTITAKDASKEYDGTALTQPEFTVSGLAEGDTHTFTVVMTDDSTITDVGTQPNVIATVDGVAVTTGTETAVGNYLVTTANGTLKITPITDKVTVTITENSDEVTYDRQPHTIKGYKSIVADNTLYDVATSVTETETTAWTVTKTDAGTYDMGIVAGDFENTNTNFTNVEFKIVDGQLKIKPITDKVMVTITENSDEVTYDGQPHTIKGYKSIVADNTLYDVATSVAETETTAWTVTKTDVGTYDMGIVAGDFENTNTNFTNVEFKIVDGQLKINPPDKVTVTITENSDEVTYDGQPHTIKGYKSIVADNTLYDVATSVAETETAAWTVTKTDAGTYDMGIVAGDFENTNTNFPNVEFKIVDGQLKIKPITDKVTVTITENSDEVTYDGQPHTIKGYKSIVADNTLYDVATSVAETETAAWTVTKTDAGTYDMGIVAGDFENTNTNFTNVEFKIVDGQLKIKPITDKVTVTITENSDEVTYDGQPHTIKGYKSIVADNTLYDVATSVAETETAAWTVTKTDAGTYDMGIVAGDFENTNTNFTNVEFKIVDGQLKIKPITDKVTVTITENSDEVTYDGQPHTIKGYKSIVADNTLYDVATSVAETETAAWTVTKTDAGTYDMGIVAGDFENTNTNFTNVEFKIVDGQLKIKPITDKVTVTITENSDEVTYDGQPHTIKGYKSIVADNTLYDVATSVAETETAAWTVTKTDAGTYDMGIVAGDFENTNTNFTNVEFKIVDGQLKIKPITDKVTVTITENSDEVTYDGQPHTIKGYKSIVADNTLYDVATSVAETETAAWTVTKTDAGTYDMGIVAGDFENTNTNFTNVEFKIVDGQLKIKPITDKVTVTITENSDEVTYDGQPHTIKGYKSIVADNTLYDVATSVAETETAAWTVTKTDAGTYDMGIVAGDFENTNTNFTNVEFKIVDGQLKIKPITDKVTVTITENSDEVTYDGQPHTIKGYKSIVADNTLYDVATSVAETETAAWTVTKTDAGTYDMGIVAGDFENTNTNFTNVEFKIVDGQLKIKPITDKVTVTITENSDEVTYDGQPHTIKGYKSIVADNTLYDVATSVAETETAAWTVTKTDAGTYDMGIVAGDFENTNTNFTNVEFKIVDGQLKIAKRAVTLTSGNAKRSYNGEALTNADVDGKNANGLTVETGWVDGEGATYSFTGSQTLVGESTNAFTVTLKENTKADNYDITKTEGKLIVDDENVPDDLVVKKTADDTVYKLGEEVTFDIWVKNIYDDIVTIKLIEIEGVTLAKDTFEGVEPGAEITTTATYTITEADILAGSFTNTVTARVVEKEWSANASVKVEDPNGHLTVIKETTSETPEGGYKLGETVTYKITVVNDGNLTITDITATDERTGDEWKIDSLAPGESKEYTASTTVTEGDILSGHIINDATAKGKSPDPDEPDVPVDPGHTDDDPEDPKGHLTVIKETTSETSEDGYKLGETLDYKITVVNDGNLTITEITVTDERTGDEWKIDSLAPGESKEYTASTTVTEGDILSGHIINDATAKGKSPDPDEPDVPVDPGHTDDDPEDPKGHLTVIKETTSETPEDGYKLGETLDYKITVVNDGNLTITEITVTDERTGDEWKIDSLAPGESKEYTASTTVTEGDILSGHIINEATAKGKSPDPDEPDVPVTPGKTDDDPEDPNGHLTVNKETTSTPKDEKGYAEGEVITYKITAVNDGNLTITNINVIDDLTGDKWPVESLAPGATKEFETSYTVTAEDAAAGEVLNVATAEGKSPDPKNPDVPVTPGEDPEPTIETKVTLIIRYWIGSKNGELINTINRVEKAGTAYDVATPPIEGYTADTERVKGVLDKDMEYDVVYTAEEYTLTILYKYQDGTEAAATYTEVLHFGDEYSVVSPTINTYYTNTKKVEGTMPARDVTVTVIYVKNPVIITIDDFETPLGIGLGSINVGETIE